MDILHHAAIGMAGSMALAASGQPLASALFLGASILPDADAAFMLKSKREYLKRHQSITHSLPLAALLSAAAVGVSSIWFPIQEAAVAGSAALASLLIHILLDASNTLGTRIFAPWGRRYRLDAAFFIDAPSWALTLLTIALLAITGLPWIFPVYVAIMTGQLLWRARLSRKALLKSSYQMAIPDPLLPWRFALARPEHDGSTSTATWSFFSGLSNEERTEVPSHRAKRQAESSSAVSDMSHFARALSIVEEKREGEKFIVILRDLAMRRLGARYGEITITEEDGRVVEKINI